MRMLFYFFFCFLWLLPIDSSSQESSKKYQFVNIKESVSKIGANSIIQDKYGFIWLSTDGAGLKKFDGTDYTTYKKELNDSTSLSNNTVYCSYSDSKNRLWFGTDVGLNLYDRDNDKFKRISLSKFKENRTNVSVRSLIEDTNGNGCGGTL